MIEVLNKNKEFYKTISYSFIHFGIAFLISYLLTGDVFISSSIALIEPVLNCISYFFHEKFWNNFIIK